MMDDPDVDYADHTEGRGFVMKDTTAKIICGCGNSFSALGAINTGRKL